MVLLNMVIKILFVCKHNMFRSKIAEACFNKLNKNKGFVASSAGLIQGYLPLDKTEVRVAKKLGIDVCGGPRGVSIELIKDQL